MKWNDPAIAKDNPGENLPDLPINVAFRSDGSGTTFVFTKHLAAISPDFADEVGTDKSVTWPVGAGGKGNEGVTALIKQTPGTIGYVEYGYAVHNGLSMASLQNKAGKFVKPTDESGAATLATSSFPEISGSGQKIPRAMMTILSRPSPGCSSTKNIATPPSKRPCRVSSPTDLPTARSSRANSVTFRSRRGRGEEQGRFGQRRIAVFDLRMQADARVIEQGGIKEFQKRPDLFRLLLAGFGGNGCYARLDHLRDRPAVPASH